VVCDLDLLVEFLDELVFVGELVVCVVWCYVGFGCDGLYCGVGVFMFFEYLDSGVEDVLLGVGCYVGGLLNMFKL